MFVWYASHNNNRLLMKLRFQGVRLGVEPLGTRSEQFAAQCGFQVVFAPAPGCTGDFPPGLIQQIFLPMIGLQC